MNVHQWKELVAGLPCVATYLLTGEKVYGCQLHHLESIRDGLSEWAVVPLTPEMHQGPNGMHGLSRRGFYNRYKLGEIELLAGTIKLAMQSNARPEYGEIAIRDAMIEGLVRSKVEESKT
jgi:hypothetical protein